MRIQSLISTKIVLLLMMFLTGISFSINAQTKVKSNSTQNEKIYINKKGEIHDHGWNKVGFITKEDIVKNNEGETIYFIDANGNVIDSKGNKLGMLKRMAHITT